MDPLSIKAGVVSVASFVALALALTPISRIRKADKKRNNVSRERFVGLETLCEPIESPEFDICFVHGLGGNARSTWTAYDDRTKEGVLWPKELLSKSFPRARILLYGYETNVHSLCWLADRTLYHHAKHLLADLSSERRKCQDRPLLFVAHSLGGLVVKSALVFAQDLASTSTDADRKIYLSTFGIVSFGTPQVFAKNPSLINFIDGLCASPHLTQLRKFEDSMLPTRKEREDIATLQTRLKSYTPIATEIPEVFCYESLEFALSTRDTAVPPKSPGLRHDLCVEVPIEADHNGMCKFSANDDNYKSICQAMGRFLNESGNLLKERRERFNNNTGHEIISGARIRELGFSVGPHLPPRNDVSSRDEPLSDDRYFRLVHEQLQEVRFAWLAGPNGPSKTSVALEYAYQHATHGETMSGFSSIFWLDARCEETLEASFLRIFDILRAYYGKEQEEQANPETQFGAKSAAVAGTTSRRLSARKDDRHLKLRHVMDWFSFPENKRWLLIYDNVEHPEAKYLHKFRPRSDAQRGYILMTSRKDSIPGSHQEEDANATKQFRSGIMMDHEDQLPASSSISSKIDVEDFSSGLNIGSWTSSPGSMLGHKSAPSSETSAQPEVMYSQPIRVESFARHGSIDSLQSLDYQDPYDTDAVGRCSTFDPIINSMSDTRQDLAHIGASLELILSPPEVPDELMSECVMPKSIPPELLPWVNACAMLGAGTIPTLLLEIGFGEDHETVLRGLEKLQALGWVQIVRRDRAFYIPRSYRRSRRQDLDGDRKSAQLVCKLVGRTLRYLAKSGNSDSVEPLDEQLLLKHMEACLDIYRKSGVSVECDWDVLAGFCERNGLHAEAAAFYNAQIEASRAMHKHRLASDVSDGQTFHDARSSISLTIPKRHHRANSSLSAYDPSMRPSAYREQHSTLGHIRMQIKLAELKDLEKICEGVLDEVRKRQYHDLEFEALRLMVDIKLAENCGPEAMEYRQALADRLEEEKGPSHPDTLSAVGQLATVHANQGDYDLAEPLLERVLIAYKQTFGNSDLRTIMVSVDLAEVYRDHGNTRKAEALYRSVLRTYRQLRGAEHIRTAKAQEGLAIVYDMEQDYKHADDNYQAALDAAKLLGEKSEEYTSMKKRYADLLERRQEDTTSLM